MSAPVVIAMGMVNSEATVGLAVASIRAQTFGDWELVIVDDGSRDRSVAVAEEAAGGDPRIRVVRRDRTQGLAIRMNEIVEHAGAPLIARMDADDVAYPRRLERQVAFLDSNPDVDLVGTSLLVFGADGRAIGKRAAPPSHAEICRRPAGGFKLFHPTWAGRAAWFRDHPYDPRDLRAEDQALLYRVYRESVYANLPEPLMGYREERLKLSPILRGRTTYAARVVRSQRSQGHPAAALATAAEQIAKGALDIAAIGARLDHRVLRQRAGPLAPEELAEWVSVWSELTGSPPASAR
jgi:glycosyltransferase involved in cell wall biosynthesis